jgi:sulfite reductase (NADPH) hemoprotein beta-component
VFARLGDYKHRQRNRMKFLIRNIGWDAFRAEFDREFETLRADTARPRLDDSGFASEAAPEAKHARPPVPESLAARVVREPLRGPGIVPTVRPELDVIGPAYARWVETNVRPQKQKGYALVSVTLPLGDLSGEQMRVLADLAEAYGDGGVRTTLEQDLLFRWVRNEDVAALQRRLAAAGLGRAEASTSVNVTSCPGAEACRLAVTQSRGLGQALSEHLAARPELVAAAPDLKLKISGCPNGCGQHHIAGIGFQGSVRRVGQRPLPQYFVMVGGGVDDSGAHFGRTVAKVPAHRVAEAAERLVRLYARDKRAGEGTAEFLRRQDPAALKVLLADLEAFEADGANEEEFVDLGEQHAFAPETLEGECSA